MIGPLELTLAFLLDLAIGDPRWLPHPVRIIGSAVTRLENLLRPRLTGSREKMAGVVLVVLIVLPSAGVIALVERLLRTEGGIPMVVGRAVIIYLVGTTLALRELTASAVKVIKAVKAGMADEARADLGMIVGRDTKTLTDDGVLRATIETLAENLSDGIIAPVFYLAIGGLPLAIAYKAVNTLDSMVGYKNERYIRFGWAAAKLDDIANYIPARVSGLLIALASFIVFRSVSIAGYSFKTMLRDGRNHTSPNSGIPESAMAGALGVRLGGPSTYGGMVVDKPYIGDSRNDDYLAASNTAVTIVFAASVMSVAAAVFSLAVRNIQ
ncbi:MAG: cobalamin biosynthesis protein CobD [Nitrospirae bacterium]|nr:cobalamin biosynthesis protein CobD [Nitrospirota bacterium]